MTIEIFEKHPTADAYKVGAAFTEYCILAKEKRFSDAEMAAEYWFMEAVNADLLARGARGDAEPGDVLAANADLETIERFATLPHFDA